jgi:hypothetical protein
MSFLIQSGADIAKGTHREGGTPLFIAVQNEHAAALKVLIDAGADVNQHLRIKPFWSPLTIAVKKGNVEIVKMLIEGGAFLNKPRADGYTALLTATQGTRQGGGQTEIAHLLIKAGANVDKGNVSYGSTPIFLAAKNGHEEIVSMLLRAGADASIRGGALKESPLSVARRKKRHAIVVLLSPELRLQVCQWETPRFFYSLSLFLPFTLVHVTRFAHGVLSLSPPLSHTLHYILSRRCPFCSVHHTATDVLRSLDDVRMVESGTAWSGTDQP